MGCTLEKELEGVLKKVLHMMTGAYEKSFLLHLNQQGCCMKQTVKLQPKIRYEEEEVQVPGDKYISLFMNSVFMDIYIYNNVL